MFSEFRRLKNSKVFVSCLLITQFLGFLVSYIFSKNKKSGLQNVLFIVSSLLAVYGTYTLYQEDMKYHLSASRMNKSKNRQNDDDVIEKEYDEFDEYADSIGEMPLDEE